MKCCSKGICIFRENPLKSDKLTERGCTQVDWYWTLNLIWIEIDALRLDKLLSLWHETSCSHCRHNALFDLAEKKAVRCSLTKLSDRPTSLHAWESIEVNYHLRTRLKNTFIALKWSLTIAIHRPQFAFVFAAASPRRFNDIPRQSDCRNKIFHETWLTDKDHCRL